MVDAHLQWILFINPSPQRLAVTKAQTDGGLSLYSTVVSLPPVGLGYCDRCNKSQPKGETAQTHTLVLCFRKGVVGSGFDKALPGYSVGTGSTGNGKQGMVGGQSNRNGTRKLDNLCDDKRAATTKTETQTHSAYQDVHI